MWLEKIPHEKKHLTGFARNCLFHIQFFKANPKKYKLALLEIVFAGKKVRNVFLVREKYENCVGWEKNHYY